MGSSDDGLCTPQVKRLPWLHTYVDMKPTGGVDVARDLEEVERTLLALSSPSSSSSAPPPPPVTTRAFVAPHVTSEGGGKHRGRRLLDSALHTPGRCRQLQALHGEPLARRRRASQT